VSQPEAVERLAAFKKVNKVSQWTHSFPWSPRGLGIPFQVSPF
jgi:hypothetical protein